MTKDEEKQWLKESWSDFTYLGKLLLWPLFLMSICGLVRYLFKKK